MNRKIGVIVPQFQHLLSEEMGIADEVVKVSQLIEKEIFKHNYTDFTCRIVTENSDVMLDVVFRTFEDKEAYYGWLQSANRQDGYSKSENTIFLSVIKIGNAYNIYDLFDTIQHEVEHYWQSKNAEKTFADKRYEAITKGMYTSDPVLFDICQILYCSNKIEIMAYVNGTYNAAIHKKQRYADVFEYLEDNSINNVYSVLKNADKKIEKFKTSYMFNALYFLKSNNIIPNNYTEANLFQYLQKIVNRARNYMFRKIARSYALYISRQKLDEINQKKGKINLIKSFGK